MLFIYYSKCSTCIKAKKWLENNNIEFIVRDIVNDNPKKQEIKEWVAKSGYDVKKFFNTSGLKYRELDLKDRLKSMTDDEKIELLSSDGMLVKRPILIDENMVLVGFKENEWKEIINNASSNI